MLKKLLKYDLKWTYKVLTVFYAMTIFFALLTRVLSFFNDSFLFNVLFQISSGALIALLINTIINNLMRVWARFVQGLYKDEGYLSHTLPVTKSQLYISKFLSALITMLTTVGVVLLCVAIAYLTKDSWIALKDSLFSAATAYNSTIVTLLITIFVTFFLEMIYALMAGFTGIILGFRSNNGRIAKSVLFGFLIYMLGQSILFGSFYLISLFSPDLMMIFTTLVVDVKTLKILLILAMSGYVIANGIFYFWNIHLFKKGVNLD